MAAFSGRFVLLATYPCFLVPFSCTRANACERTVCLASQQPLRLVVLSSG